MEQRGLQSTQACTHLDMPGCWLISKISGIGVHSLAKETCAHMREYTSRAVLIFNCATRICTQSLILSSNSISIWLQRMQDPLQPCRQHERERAHTCLFTPKLNAHIASAPFQAWQLGHCPFWHSTCCPGGDTQRQPCIRAGIEPLLCEGAHHAVQAGNSH